MKTSLEAWYEHVCRLYAWGKITERIMRKYQTRYEHHMKAKWDKSKQQ